VSMRWMTQDPVRDGTNWYKYCMGDPINLWDPLGLHWAGGANIEYPEDFNPNDISLESSVEKSKHYMNYLTGEEVVKTLEVAKNTIRKEYRRQAYYDIEYKTKPIYNIIHPTAERIKPIVSSIPPDQSVVDIYKNLYVTITQEPLNSKEVALGVLLETGISSGINLFAEDIDFPSSQELKDILNLNDQDDDC